MHGIVELMAVPRGVDTCLTDNEISTSDRVRARASFTAKSVVGVGGVIIDTRVTAFVGRTLPPRLM